MSGITDPSEEYFKDGLWAWVTDQWKKLVADASNFLQVNVAAQDIDVEVTQQAAADLTPGVMGWDGSAWRKLPLLWGFSEQYLAKKAETGADAGDNWLSFALVPAGEIWIVESVCARADAATVGRVDIVNYDGSNSYFLASETYVAAWEGIFSPTTFVLVEGDRVAVLFADCAGGEDLYAYANGYKMKITE